MSFEGTYHCMLGQFLVKIVGIYSEHQRRI